MVFCPLCRYEKSAAMKLIKIKQGDCCNKFMHHKTPLNFNVSVLSLRIYMA